MAESDAKQESFGEDDEKNEAVSRRQFVLELTATTGAWALGAREALSESRGVLPNPLESGIEHIVVVMMENRSFDHFLGWTPGADGKQAGLTYIDRNGLPQSTFSLAPEFQGCGRVDPDHSYSGGRQAYNNGACDGWLVAGQNDAFAIGYYTASDLAFWSQAVPAWTTFDRYFSAILAPTFPNRIYQYCAQTDRLNDSALIVRLPTIWDRLQEKGIEARYYYSNIPFLALWGAKYLHISSGISRFLNDCATNNLPQVAFVDPRYTTGFQEFTNDDHPFADIRGGEAFLNQIYRAVTTSQAWPKTVLIFNFDEWGGFFDHVPPPLAPLPWADRLAGSDGRIGFRVPSLLVAPWARRGFVSNTQFDHTSVLKMIEWRWGLTPLTVRDGTANNLAEELDFNNPNLSVPQFSVAPGPFRGLCPEVKTARTEWLSLASLAKNYSFGIDTA
jgi:phospholipase C